MSDALRRAVRFVRSNGGLRRTASIVIRKVRRCGLGDALRALVSRISPAPKWPQLRYERYIELHESKLRDAWSALPDADDGDPAYGITYVTAGLASEINEAIGNCATPYIAVIAPCCELGHFAKRRFADAVRSHPECDAFYCDEDYIDDRSLRRNPAFKPQWSPYTLLSIFYIGGVTIARVAKLRELGSLRESADPLAMYDLWLRLSEASPKVFRIAGVCAHRTRPVEINYEVERRIKLEAMERRGCSAHCECVRLADSQLRIDIDCGLCSAEVVLPDVGGEPSVDIIIPTKDHVSDLSRCIDTILAKTDYKNYRVCVIDNGSTDRYAKSYLAQLAETGRAKVIRHDEPFNFSAMNNLAVAQTKGDYLLFLNNDTEVMSHDWLRKMLGFAALRDVGAVGAKLLYPDGTVQHAGVAKVGAGPTHVFNGLPGDYPHPLLQCPCEWSAVTGACMMVSREKFAEAGGFDEDMAVAFNDVDLCFKLRSLGYRNVYVSQAVLLHREFSTRGNDRSTELKRSRMFAALDRLYEKWPAMRDDDPGYNPELTRDFPDFMPRN